MDELRFDIEAVRAVLASRAQYNAHETFEDPSHHFTCVAMLKAVLGHYTWRGPTDPARHALDMVLLKVARLATGKYDPDHILDGQGYLELIKRMVEAGSAPKTPKEGA